MLTEDGKYVKLGFFIYEELCRLYILVSNLDISSWSDIYGEELKDPHPDLLKEFNQKALEELELFYSQVNFRKEILKSKLLEEKL